MNKQEMIEVIQKCNTGDEAAYEKLYRAYYPFAFRYAYKISKCEADAHDIAQMTMISVYDNLHTLTNLAYFPAWMKRITFHQCIRIFRKNTHVVYNDEMLSKLESNEDNILENEPQKSLHFNNDRDIMVYLLGLLPSAQREVMEIYYFEQLTTREIAERLSVAEGTVKSRLFTAKRELKKKILQYEKEEDITLDFNANSLFALLGSGTLLPSLFPFLSKAKNGTVASVSNILIVSTIAVGVGAGGYALYEKSKEAPIYEKASYENALPSPVINKTFIPTTSNKQEIKTAQDAYFKIFTFSNTEQDLKSSSYEECIEIEKLLQALKEYGGEYYQTLESSGWIEEFYKYSNINERNDN